jgi:hypothetical protein
MAQVGESLSSEYESLSTNPNTLKERSERAVSSEAGRQSLSSQTRLELKYINSMYIYLAPIIFQEHIVMQRSTVTEQSFCPLGVYISIQQEVMSLPPGWLSSDRKKRADTY